MKNLKRIHSTKKYSRWQFETNGIDSDTSFAYKTVRNYSFCRRIDKRKRVDISCVRRERMYFCVPFRSNSNCILLLEIGAALKISSHPGCKGWNEF